jgi:hypothetical protein
VQLIDLAGLRHWAERRNLTWSGQYRRCPLLFGPNPIQFAWPWPRPQGRIRSWWLADFILAGVKVSALQDLGGWFLWPNDGRWLEGGKDPYYRVSNAVLNALGIPLGFEGAAHFETAEVAALAAAVFARCFMMDDSVGTVADHVYVFPDHGRLGLYFVDEELTWVLAATREPLDQFNQELIGLGWDWLRDKSRNDLVFPGALEDGVA